MKLGGRLPGVFLLMRCGFLFRWDEGLLDMCIGDKRKLTIPPEFGYGQRAMGAIPAGSTLSESILSVPNSMEGILMVDF